MGNFKIGRMLQRERERETNLIRGSQAERKSVSLLRVTLSPLTGFFEILLFCTLVSYLGQDWSLSKWSTLRDSL
jgi:hypothetical protein